jgi:predicted O-methyltransferase YrrM
VQRAVETGVARGITSRAILEALARNRSGQLWSIDLAPLHRSDLDREIGVVVPSEQRDRWTLIEGSSRHRLPGLLERLGGIDLFVHDSLHSERNVRFELQHAWPFLRPGGAAIVDDVHMNAGFDAFSQRAGDAESVICLADDRNALFAIALKRSRPASTAA